MKEKMHSLASTLVLVLVVMALAFLFVYVPQMTAVHK